MDKHVLVVEDDKALNRLICHVVSLAGFPVRSALDGSTALLSASEYPPALVLLDLMLPDITGFEVCRGLKHDAATSSAIVVMVTALGDHESRCRGLACGAAEYVVKPLHPDQLIETIQRYVA